MKDKAEETGVFLVVLFCFLTSQVKSRQKAVKSCFTSRNTILVMLQKCQLSHITKFRRLGEP